MEKYRIDPELNNVLPELSEEDYEALEKSLLTDGFKGAPIMVWGDIIVDGHNRYEICNRHNIPYEVKKVEFDSKEEAIRWMVRQQIGRRTMTSLQRIAVVEKHKPFYEEKARKNKSANGGDKKSKLKNSATPIPKEQKIDVRAELAKDANVSTDTYSKGVKILNSGNNDLIQQTLSGEKTINRAYKELRESQKKESVSQNKIADISDKESELQDLKNDRRREAAQNVKSTREKYGFDSPEYENAKAEQVSIETRINELESSIHNTQKSDACKLTLDELQNRWNDYLPVFQKDIEWLLSKEFYKNDEEVTGKTHSDLQNCLEKFKSVSDLIRRMSIDELGDIVIGK